MVICCVDNPTARLATAFLAALYLKPLLDIGTGILRTPDGRRMGADVRLVLPGHCLLCLGGIPGMEEAPARLQGWHAGDALDSDPVAWWRQRAGSLRSLNQLAAAAALRLLEELARGTLRRSTWLHFEFSEEGIPALEERLAERDLSCGLCALSAAGDAGLGSLSIFASATDSGPRDRWITE